MRWVKRVHWWVTRGWCLAGAVVVMILVPATMVVSAPDDRPLKLGQTPPALMWIQLEDSQGISVWNHELSLDRGGVTSPDKWMWSSLTDIMWSLYRNGCVLAIWFLDWVMSMDWMGPLSAPVLAVGNALQKVVDDFGLVPTLLTVTALVCVFWMARGKWATGIWELGMAMVIAVLATGFLADPVRMVAGPDGYIEQTALAGQEVAAALATGDTAGKTPEQLRADQTGQLVDVFVRYPNQLINYGAVLDGGACASVYNDTIRDGPYGYESDVRDAVGDCDKTFGEYAESPSGAMASGATVFVPAAGVLLLLAIVISGSVIGAGITVLYQSIKVIVTLISGLLPGGGRSSFLLTVAEAAMSLLILFVTSVFLAVFLQVISYLFNAGGNVAQTFLVIDILLIMGTIIYWRQRKHIKNSAARLAQWMGQRPGAEATKMPQRQRGGELGSAMGAVRTVTSMSQARNARAMANRPQGSPNTFIDAKQQAMVFNNWPRPNENPGPDLRPPPNNRRALNPSPGPGPNQDPGPGPGPGPGPIPRPGPGGGPGGAMRRINARTGKAAKGVLVRAGTNAALAAATGGSSLAVTAPLAAARGAKAIQTTRRAVVATRLAAATTQAATNQGSRSPARPMPPRTQPAPPQTGASSPASRRVIDGSVVSSRTTPPASPQPGGRATPPIGNTTSSPPRPASKPARTPGDASPQSAGSTAPAMATSPRPDRRGQTPTSTIKPKPAHQSPPAPTSPKTEKTNTQPVKERQEPRPSTDSEAARLARLQGRLNQRPRKR